MNPRKRERTHLPFTIKRGESLEKKIHKYNTQFSGSPVLCFFKSDLAASGDTDGRQEHTDFLYGLQVIAP